MLSAVMMSCPAGVDEPRLTERRTAVLRVSPREHTENPAPATRDNPHQFALPWNSAEPQPSTLGPSAPNYGPVAASQLLPNSQPPARAVNRKAPFDTMAAARSADAASLAVIGTTMPDGVRRAFS